MTKEGYKKIRDDYYASGRTEPKDRDGYLKAFLDWVGAALDGFGVKYITAEEVKNEQAEHDMVRAL